MGRLLNYEPVNKDNFILLLCKKNLIKNELTNTQQIPGYACQNIESNPQAKYFRF